MNLIDGIRHVAQRTKKGYSYRDLWSIDWWFLTVIPDMLEDFANEKYLGIPMSVIIKFEQEHPEITGDEKDEACIQQWRNTIREIAHHLREGHLPKDQVNEYDNEFFDIYNLDGILTPEDFNKPLTPEQEEIRDKWRKRQDEIEKYQQEQFKIGMQMLTDNMFDLWW